MYYKKWIEVRVQPGSTEDRYKPSKRLRFKASMLNQIYVITAMHMLFLKEILLL